MRSLYASMFLRFKLETSLEEALRLQKSCLDLRNHGLEEDPLDLLLTLPEDYLYSLQFIFLQFNSIRTFSRKLCHVLNNLKGLTLDYNELTDFPFDFHRLSNLTILNVSHNRFDGLHFFYVICQLENLRILWANCTGIDEIPPEIGHLTNLRTLGLRRNFIRGIPLELTQLRELRWLTLANNEISQLPPEICQLSLLKHFSLLGNKLGDLPETFNQLPELQYLFLSGNKLKIDSDLKSFLRSIPKLKYCSISKNIEIRSTSNSQEDITSVEEEVSESSMIDTFSELRIDAGDTVNSGWDQFPVDLSESRHQSGFVEETGTQFSATELDGVQKIEEEEAVKVNFSNTECLNLPDYEINGKPSVGNDSLLATNCETWRPENDKGPLGQPPCNLQCVTNLAEGEMTSDSVETSGMALQPGSRENANKNNNAEEKEKRTKEWALKNSPAATSWDCESNCSAAISTAGLPGINSQGNSLIRDLNTFVDETILEGVASANLASTSTSSASLIFLLPHGRERQPFNIGARASIMTMSSQASSTLIAEPHIARGRHSAQSPLASLSWSSSTFRHTDSTLSRRIRDFFEDNELINPAVSSLEGGIESMMDIVENDSDYDPSDWDHSTPSSAIDDQEIASRFNDFLTEAEQEGEPGPALVHDWEWRKILSIMFLC